MPRNVPGSNPDADNSLNERMWFSGRQLSQGLLVGKQRHLTAHSTISDGVVRRDQTNK